MTDLEEKFDRIFRYNAVGARTHYGIALRAGMAQPVMFLLDMHDRLSRALVDACGGEGASDLLTPLANAAPGEIPTGILPLPLTVAERILGTSAPELADMLTGAIDLRGKIPVVVVSTGKVAVDMISIGAPGAN